MDRIELEHPSWVWSAPSPGTTLEVQVRAHGRTVPATVEGATLWLSEPEYGVAPGQTAALYDGDEVVGGGIVASASRAGVTSSAGTQRERP